jgi:hypothetical protein
MIAPEGVTALQALERRVGDLRAAVRGEGGANALQVLQVLLERRVGDLRVEVHLRVRVPFTPLRQRKSVKAAYHRLPFLRRSRESRQAAEVQEGTSSL